MRWPWQRPKPEVRPEFVLRLAPDDSSELTPMLVALAAFMAIHTLSHSWAESSKSAVQAAPHTFGHFAATSVAFSLLACVGIYGWLGTDLSSVDHIGDFVPVGRFIASLQVGFMTYEMCAIVMANGRERQLLCGPGGVMVVHHCFVLVLAWLIALNSFMHYYAIFFFGIPELSSVPLAWVDLFKGVPELKRRFPNANEAARSLFAVVFLPVRCVWFSLVNREWWRDALVEVATGALGTPRWLLGLVCVSNCVLQGMQYYWGGLIVRAIVAKATGAPPPKGA